MKKPQSAESFLSEIIILAKAAGKAIMAVYSKKDFGITYKTVDSPLTQADISAHDLILAGLKKLSPNLPILSEESKTIPYEQRRSWSTYWLVDPLDGTKEFIKRNDEFTVNIALIEKGSPVMGVVHAPALDLTYYAETGKSAFKQEGKKKPVKIKVSDYRNSKLKIAISRSHKDEPLDHFLQKIQDYESIRMGSSLKFCLIAEGTAHLYPRFGPTMEWDTAAAQCVVTEAGGMVTDLSGKSLRYNKPDLTNPDFIVSGQPAYPWKALLDGETPHQSPVSLSQPQQNKSSNTVWHHATVTRQRREAQNVHKSIILWFTGLSGSGKSTLAHAVEEKLFQMACRTFVFDGDNVRHGLCSNLGFSKDDRTENIRRIGEMAKLFIEAGVIALTAFISPFKADRERVRRLVPEGDFIEIYCHCPLEVCEQRDTKGLYKRARAGEVKEFTGISSPYEPPDKPELILNTAESSIEECTEVVLELLIQRTIIMRDKRNILK
jgi:adenylylsulfate kinase